MRVDPNVLDCALYLYPSVEDAENGERAGGSGFVVGVPATPGPGFFIYAVTNRHIIEDARATVVRLNTTANTFDVLPTDPQSWLSHPDGEDVAACTLGLDTTHRAQLVSTRLFLTKEQAMISAWVGAEVHTVGRFVNHEGRQQNQPVVRCGHIAAIPGEPIQQHNKHQQVSYLVEGYSMSGYSGSPVFVDTGGGSPYGPPTVSFLGVVWGHLLDDQPVKRRKDERPSQWQKHPDGWLVEGNSGMMGVVPAWMLRELLDQPEFLHARQDEEARLARGQES